MDARIDPLTLCVDASTYAGTVAVLRGGELFAERDAAMRGEMEERLMPAIGDALAAAAVRVGDIERVVCGGGPGSFTSLRIAAAIAKGLAVTTGAPLYAIPSLTLIVAGARPALGPGDYLAVLDAPRGDRFVAHVEIAEDGAVIERSPATVTSVAALGKLAESLGATIAGPGAQLNLRPHARGASLLGSRLMLGSPVDVRSWEPDYGRKAEAQVRWEAVHGRSLSGR